MYQHLLMPSKISMLVVWGWVHIKINLGIVVLMLFGFLLFINSSSVKGEANQCYATIKSASNVQREPVIYSQNTVTIRPSVFSGYDTLITGREKLLFDEDWNGTHYCLKSKGIETIISDDKTYYLPEKLNITDRNGNAVLKKEYNSELVRENNKFCINILEINPFEYPYLKLGEQSVILEGISTYDSSDINITQEEEGLAHLSVNNSKDILLYSPFNVNMSGTVIYDYGKIGNNLNMINEPMFNKTGGIWGKGSYELNGKSQYFVNTAFNKLSSYPFSFCFWQYRNLNNLTGNTVPIAITKSAVTTVMYGIRNLISPPNSIDLFARNTVLYNTSPHLLSNNSWHHICGIYANTTWKGLYIDGSLVDILTTLVNPDSGTNAFSIGAIYNTNPSGFYVGTVSDVLVINRTLTESEVFSIYQNESRIFNSTGKMTFQNVLLNKTIKNNMNNTIDVVITQYTNVSGSNIKLKVNKGLPKSFLPNGTLFNYSVDGMNNTGLNITILFYSDSNGRFTPSIKGNITITSYNVSYSKNTTGADTTPPVFTKALNTSPNFYRYQNATTSITITDETGMSKWTFGTNVSGSWVNKTYSNTTISFNASVSFNITPVIGTHVGWQYYANDSSNNRASSNVYSFIVADVPEVTYTPAATSLTITPQEPDQTSTIKLYAKYVVGGLNATGIMQFDWYVNWTFKGSLNATGLSNGNNATVTIGSLNNNNVLNFTARPFLGETAGLRNVSAYWNVTYVEVSQVFNFQFLNLGISRLPEGMVHINWSPIILQNFSTINCT